MTATTAIAARLHPELRTLRRAIHAEPELGNDLPRTQARVLAALEGLVEDEIVDVIFAYEPVWAIGSGEAASPEQAEEVCRALRASIAELRDEDVADRTRILYGGSVTSLNIASFLRQPNIDGALVGGASLDATEFSRIVQFKKHVTGA